jgi:hypothetical protein
LATTVNIRHQPGIQNPVADGLSRMWRNRKRSQMDGSMWSVLLDWEASKGIQNNVMAVLDSPHPTEHPLIIKFKGDIFFTPIVKHLLGKSTGDSIMERRKAMHRAEGFMLEDNKLWRVSSKTRDRVPRTECIPTTLGFQLALDTHKANGHFSTDILKLHLRDHYFWPGLDTDCRQACIECSHCKGFGPAKLNALLQPIRRVQPFDLTGGLYCAPPIPRQSARNMRTPHGLRVDSARTRRLPTWPRSSHNGCSESVRSPYGVRAESELNARNPRTVSSRNSFARTGFQSARTPLIRIRLGKKS